MHDIGQAGLLRGGLEALMSVGGARLIPTSAATEPVHLAWAGILSSSPPPDETLGGLEHDARANRHVGRVLEIAALRSLAAEGRGELARALDQARRASRMARTEAIPEAEWLANVILARQRRLSGRPYLATRILIALHDLAPAPWHPWIEWELGLASGLRHAEPGTVLHPWLASATAGEPAVFAQQQREVATRIEDLAPFREDLRRARALVDPTCNHDADPELIRWRCGEDPFAAPPFGLAGLHDGDTGIAAVVTGHAGAPRRILRIGTAFVHAQADATLLDDKRAGRTEAILAALALAGMRGLDESGLFEHAYGFGYKADLHRGAFDVALHRARSRLGALGSIEREKGSVRLVPRRALLLTDPRPRPPPSERVLHRLATEGEVSARELARLLGVPLRSVQESLRSLVDAGACRQQRNGRRVLYSVQDTTFREPTKV